MNNADLIREYLNSKSFAWRQRGDEAILNCPVCGDKDLKFSINLASGLYQCFHKNTCGISGSFNDLQMKLGDKPEKLPQNVQFAGQKEKTYIIPDQGKQNLLKIDQVKVYEYLVSRGFTIETIKHFRIGAREGQVLFPYFKHGILSNIKYRDITDKHKQTIETGAAPTLFNRDQVYDNTLIICEGEFDAMALYQYGFNATSCPNGVSALQWIDVEWEYLETFSSIILCYDNDSAGQEWVAKVASRLGEWKCRNVIFPFKDANECLMNKVPKEKIAQCITDAKDFKPDNIVTPTAYLEKVQRLFSQGAGMMGVKTAWGSLDKILKGWRDGELTIWSGRNGSGKSTILNQHVLHMAKNDIKTCIYSGEMPPERYLRWAVIQHKENDAPHPSVIESSMKWMDGRIYILNISTGIDPKDLFTAFEYAARRYDVRHFIVDSLMKVLLGGEDNYGKQKEFASDLSDFAKKHRVHVHLVAHPRKTARDQDEPGKVDIKGTSHITDLADNVIVLYRPDEDVKEKQQKKNRTVSDCQLYVKKNREFGVEGRVHLYFSEITKKFND